MPTASSKLPFDAVTDPASYPYGRPQYFAMKFIQLLANERIAVQLGPTACWLLAVIATREDALHYKPTNFYVTSLAERCNRSVRQTQRIIDELVRGGWLHWFKPGNREMATCWVLVPIGLQTEFERVSKMSRDVSCETSREASSEMSSDVSPLYPSPSSLRPNPPSVPPEEGLGIRVS